MTGFALVKALHLICAVLWVGGMFFAYVVLRPGLSVLEPPQRLLLHTQVFRRFFLVVWHAMPLIILSGFALVFQRYGGMQYVPWPVNAMMAIGLLMAAIFVVIVFGPYRRFRGTSDRQVMVGNLDTIRRLIGVNLVLGLVTIIIAAFAGG
jgi:uncharacterized membrane protein